MKRRGSGRRGRGRGRRGTERKSWQEIVTGGRATWRKRVQRWKVMRGDGERRGKKSPEPGQAAPTPKRKAFKKEEEEIIPNFFRQHIKRR